MLIKEEEWVDPEWVGLIEESKELGLTIKEIEEFLQHGQVPMLLDMKK
ncbi:DNA-binding anti-repressor SinI [Halobacillus trueperi]